MASGSLRHDNLVPVSAMPYDNVTRKHYDSEFQLTGHGVSNEGRQWPRSSELLADQDGTGSGEPLSHARMVLR